jgi:hypothetical protein
MKLFTMIILSVFLGKSCSIQNKNDIKTATIEYTANTRGFYKKISVQNQMISVSKNRNEVEMPAGRKISDSDWKELINCFETLKLEHLATLKAPTEKRFYDGAAIANLKISTKDTVFESASFDHGYPPEEINKIVKKLISISGKKE